MESGSTLLETSFASCTVEWPWLSVSPRELRGGCGWMCWKDRMHNEGTGEGCRQNKATRGRWKRWPKTKRAVWWSMGRKRCEGRVGWVVIVIVVVGEFAPPMANRRRRRRHRGEGSGEKDRSGHKKIRCNGSSWRRNGTDRRVEWWNMAMFHRWRRRW